MMLYVDYHIWDSFQVDSLVKGLWIPRLPRFSILSPTLNSHNFFENYQFPKFLDVLKSYGPESFISGKKVIAEHDWSITRHTSFGRISQKLRFGGLHHPIDGLITSYWCNYIKLAEIGNRADRDREAWQTTHRQTDRHTDEQTSNSGDPLHKRPKGQKCNGCSLLEGVVGEHPLHLI